MWKEFNSHRIFLVHKYGRRDVIWKLSIDRYLNVGERMKDGKFQGRWNNYDN